MTWVIPATSIPRAGASGIGVTLVTRDQGRELAGMVGGLGLHRELELAGLPSGGAQQVSTNATRSRPGGARNRSGARGGQGSGGSYSAGPRNGGGSRRGRPANRGR